MKNIFKLRLTIFLSLIITILLISGCQIDSRNSELPEGTELAPSMTTSIFSPTVIDNLKYSNPALFIRKDDGGTNQNKIEILDKSFNEISSFSNDSQYLYLSINDCALYALNKLNKGIDIKKIDYHGKIIDQRKISIDGNDDPNTYNYLISPNVDWITYIKVSGDWGMSYDSAEVQDLFLLENDNSQTQIPIRLSDFGGAKPESTSWSPDSKYLAFTDLDNNGVSQLFIFDVSNNRKIQISSYSENFDIYQIHWSSDSSRIIFSQSIKTDDLRKENEIWQYSILSDSFIKIPIDESTPGEFFLWWGKNNQIMLVFEGISGTFEHLWLYDTNQNSIYQEIDKNDLLKRTGLNNIYSEFPLNEDLNTLVIFGDPILYDIQNSSIDKIPLSTITDVFSGRYEVIRNSSGNSYPIICDE